MTMVFQYVGGVMLWFGVTFLILWLFRRKRGFEKGDICKMLLIAYLVGVCSQTIFPRIDFGIVSETGRPYVDIRFRSSGMGGLNLVPFQTILRELTGNNPLVGEEDRFAVAALNLLGNICLYVPVGFFLPLAWKKGERLGAVLLFAAAFSCAIEGLQYLIHRSADIDDILLSLVGAAIGYGIWKCTAARISMGGELLENCGSNRLRHRAS